MLKIREYDDNGNKIDLKVLEKFGFKHQNYDNSYIINLGEDRRGAYCTLYVENRILYINFAGDDNGYSGNDVLNDVIYDLIKANLVEKVDAMEKILIF